MHFTIGIYTDIQIDIGSHFMSMRTFNTSAPKKESRNKKRKLITPECAHRSTKYIYLAAIMHPYRSTLSTTGVYEHTPANIEVKIVFLDITLGVSAASLKSKIETHVRSKG